MSAATRSKRPIFAPARTAGHTRRRFASFLATTALIALSTWGGVLIAHELGGSGRMNSGVARWVNRQVDALLGIDPVLAAVLAALTGFVCIAFFVRDHN